MYACILEIGGGFFEGGVLVGRSGIYFSRPIPTLATPFANCFIPISRQFSERRWRQDRPALGAVLDRSIELISYDAS